MAVAAASFLSGCGGGGGSAPTPGTLTGSTAVGSSAVSRVGRASIGSLQNQLNRIRPAQGSANLITRGRQGLDFDEELGLYYRYRSDATGVWIELFEDAAGQRPAGEVVCKEDDSSYEMLCCNDTPADYRHPPRKVNAHTKRTQQQKNCGASCTPHPSPTPHDAPNATPDYEPHPQTCA
jgi:hypothetical protein